MSAKENLRDYMRGWTVATNFGPISDEDNTNPDFKKGWKEGRAAKDEAYQAACQFYKTKPEYIRSAKSGGTNVQVGNMIFVDGATAFQKAAEAQREGRFGKPTPPKKAKEKFARKGRYEH